MYVQKVEIISLRTITTAGFELNHPDLPVNEAGQPLALPNVNLVLGNNGGGKSTILRAIALGLLTPVIESAGYVPYSLVRRTGKTFAKDASVTLKVVFHEQDFAHVEQMPEQVTLTSRVIRRGSTEFVQPDTKTDKNLWDGMYHDDTLAFFFVGYGATRRVESSDNFDSATRKRSRHLRYQRVASLFEDHVSLIPLTAWLPSLKTENKGRYTQVVNLINKLLPTPFSFKGDIANGEFMFRHGEQDVPFPALSDGYKAYVGWVTDMLYHVCMGCPSGKKLVANRGIVMVDEIDLHLHPAWQRTVVPMMATALPNIQFIFTTHSPIVTGTLEPKNIFIVEEQSPGACTIKQYEESVHGHTAEQVLLSSYFDLPSTRAPAITEQITSIITDTGAPRAERVVQALKLLTNPARSLAADKSSPAVKRRKRPVIPGSSKTLAAAKKKPQSTRKGR
ncbi:ATP-binding protein [Phragmitibacter flavus]|uniref:ATP-binding protein n=1 Tax=Phragmitibacter flavus TaxID=2576071 RepID=A0A5R8KGA6_9BACT|nr:AAA family ATPase [Phragmitibacter flavus]TLD71338.1 ATP-binding protein [Phragmitibacter flavus]